MRPFLTPKLERSDTAGPRLGTRFGLAWPWNTPTSVTPEIPSILREPRPTKFSPIHPFAFIACARGLLFYLPDSLHYYGHE
jgi:hypothetical protein